MAEIRILDAETINQIAAGEVVERPASVVKELVENAIDAHADAISVEIKDGGVGMIRITDNGDGIEEGQVRNAFERHATSKIRTAEDLMAISSLGFRGGALSSIAAVARVELFTKTKDTLAGIHYVIEGGMEREYSEAGMPDGTTFVIRNLFYNTPARRKFLKSNASETARIQELMVQLAFSHPEISFKFTAQGQTKLHTGGRHKLNEIVYEVYGREIAGQLLEVHGTNDLLQINGYLGSPVIGRGNRNFEHYFINGRYIKSKIVNKAIEDAYQGFLMQHKYPFVVLSITMPANLLDCNVHPAKMEVRFSDGVFVYEAIKECVHARLKEQEMILRAPVGDILRAQRNVDHTSQEAAHKSSKQELSDEVQVKQRMTGEVSTGQTSGKTQASCEAKAEQVSVWKKSESMQPSQESCRTEAAMVCETTTVYQVHTTEQVSANEMTGRHEKEEYVPEPFEKKQRAVYEKQREESIKAFREEQAQAEQMELFDDRFLSKKAAKRHRIIGQVFSTYWIVEYDEKMFLIDQHAAHEKVNYEHMVKQQREKQMTSQQISPPIVLTLNAQEEEKLTLYADYFARLGYVIEPFGGRDYAISAVPANLYGLVGKELFYQILDELDPEIGRKSETLILEKLASMSCKAAVKGGMKISYAEMDALLGELLELEDPYHCPHGRPVIVSFSKQDLEKLFKRIV